MAEGLSFVLARRLLHTMLRTRESRSDVFRHGSRLLRNVRVVVEAGSYQGAPSKVLSDAMEGI